MIDSRAVGPGDLFVGLPGERVDGGAFAAAALEAGAWGVLVGAASTRRRAAGDGRRHRRRRPAARAAARSPRAWRRELACPVIGVTGSVGKTSTKDLLAALLAPHRRTVANRENLNTEIGLPLTVLAAPAGHRGARARDGRCAASARSPSWPRSPSPTSA